MYSSDIMARSSVPTGRTIALIALKCFCLSGMGVFRDCKNRAVSLAFMPAMREESDGLKNETNRFMALL